MRRYCLVTMLMLSLPVATAYCQAPDDKASIKGSWLLTGSTTPAGTKIPSELIDKLMGQLTFEKDGTYEQHAAGMKVEAGKYKLDAGKKPTWIDLTPTEGTSKGKVQLGIVKVADGKLTIALSPAGSGERPKDFENARKAEVSTYKRSD